MHLFQYSLTKLVFIVYINYFHVTGVFQYSLKTLENL